MNHDTSKMVSSIHEALVKCGAHDGMTLGFHHHFRDGDLVVNMVMEEVHKMGIKDVTICASSLGKAHAPLVPMIERWNDYKYPVIWCTWSNRRSNLPGQIKRTCNDAFSWRKNPCNPDR